MAITDTLQAYGCRYKWENLTAIKFLNAGSKPAILKSEIYPMAPESYKKYVSNTLSEAWFVKKKKKGGGDCQKITKVSIDQNGQINRGKVTHQNIRRLKESIKTMGPDMK